MFGDAYGKGLDPSGPLIERERGREPSCLQVRVDLLSGVRWSYWYGGDRVHASLEEEIVWGNWDAYFQGLATSGTLIP